MSTNPWAQKKKNDQRMFRPLLYSRSKARAIRTQTRLSVRQFRVPARLTEADRKLGTVVAIEGEGADQWITIEEEKSKVLCFTDTLLTRYQDFFYWVVWPFNYHGKWDRSNTAKLRRYSGKPFEGWRQAFLPPRHHRQEPIQSERLKTASNRKGSWF